MLSPLMKWKSLLGFVLFFVTSVWAADSRTLRWSRLAVTANLDGDGRLHVQERHSIIFNGDWNGGERIFRSSLENVIELERISRIDASGRAIPLRYDKSLGHVDDYAWSDSNTLRWRGRLPSDPPFHNQEITYLIEYTDANILIPSNGSYLLDHNFGLPDLKWPIDSYSLDLALDPVWQPLDDVPKHITRSNQPQGANVTVTAHLRHTGAAQPAAVNLGTPASLRYALLAVLLAGAAFFFLLFLRRERAVGRFQPLPDPASIDRRWLDANVFKFPPEVVGAAWDDRTGAAEVAAVIARMVQEGKLTSSIEKGGFFKGDDLVLKLLRPKASFEGYEAALVKSLFVDGDTTSTQKIKAHYKGKGFDPVSKIRDPLQKKVADIGKTGGAPKIDWKLTVALAATGVALLILGGFSGPLDIVGGTVAGCIILALYTGGSFGALDYRRRLSNLGLSAVEFVLPILLILAIPAILLLRVIGFRFNTFMLCGLVLVALAAIRSIFNLAKSRDAGDRLENRRRLTAAREYFARELHRPQPALEDAWFPYLLAFGLGVNVDRWFHAFGGKSNVGSSFGSSSHSTSTSSSTSSSGWTGGGGAFGGAGASGTWAVAAAGMAAGVSRPGSSGGGGGGGGGSSGGGGGGGW
jgi:uncharacterized membrane protein YgcG